MTYARLLTRMGYDMMALGAEASGVVALRMLKLAAGGQAAAAEAQLMVAEKIQAAAEVQAQAWGDALAGRGHLTPRRATALYRRKVRANRRRLAKP